VVERVSTNPREKLKTVAFASRRYGISTKQASEMLGPFGALGRCRRTPFNELPKPLLPLLTLLTLCLVCFISLIAPTPACQISLLLVEAQKPFPPAVDRPDDPHCRAPVAAGLQLLKKP
jgi:hypothetical protein